jgi:hypothetical protein
VALWEVVQETEPAEGSPKFDLFGGDFQANYPPADAPVYVTLAQSYLNSLTGNDAVFYENPDLRGRELARLQGLANANGVAGLTGLLGAASAGTTAAQSQFALRYVGGGAPGAGGLGRALTGLGGGLGALGGGIGPLGGVGGFGGGGGAGGGALLGPGGGGTVPGTGGTAPPLGTGETTTPPGTTPPTTTVTTPPVGGPETPGTPGTPGTPVPAPAGLLLGGVALGTLGAWRLGARMLAKK